MTTTQLLVERLLDLWSAPLDPAVALGAFADVYTDPVTINGAAVPVGVLVDRAASLHAALERTGVEILDVVSHGDRVVLAFEMTARHVGPWRSPLGVVEPATGTCTTVTVRTVDVLTLTDGRVSGIVVVSDEAGLLAQLGCTLGGAP